MVLEQSSRRGEKKLGETEGPRLLLSRCGGGQLARKQREVRTNCVSAGLRRGRRAVAAPKEAWSAIRVPRGSSSGHGSPGDRNASAPSLPCRRPFFQDSAISPGSGGAGSQTSPPSSPPCPARLHAIRPGPTQPSPSALTAPTAPAAPPLPRLLPHPLPAVAAPPDPSRAGPGGSEHVGPLRPEPETGLCPASSQCWSPSRRWEVWSLCARGGWRL